MNTKTAQNLLFGMLILFGTTLASSCTKTVCDNTCAYAYDGVCDDGGQGSSFSVCDCGTDCFDCGERKKGIGASTICK